MHGLLFTEYLIAPTEAEHVSLHPPDGTCSLSTPAHLPCFGLCPSTKDVNALTRDQLQALWHMRIGHINEQLVSDPHKYIDGAPALPRSNVPHSYPMCAQAKLHKANHGDTDTTEATNCLQDIQIDFGFFVQCSSG